MDNQPQNPVQQNTAPTPAASAQVKPASQAAKPGVPLPKDQSKSNRKLIIGCVSAFGCSLLLFIGVLFAFLMFGSKENPIFGFLGVPPSEVVNVLITLINLIFLVLVFISFIFVVIGIFKITTAKKEDKDAKRKSMMFTFGAFSVMVVLIFIWIFAYFFLASQKTPTQKQAITTTPAITTNLTAPVQVKFDATNAQINKNQFNILSYNWDFGDGTKLVGNPQTHTFTELGNFTVKLTISTKEKATGKDKDYEFTKDVTIQNVTANVIIKASETKGTIPLTVDFDGSESNSPNGEITAYAWDLNEDGKYDDGDKETAKMTYEKEGTYKVSLRVTDSTGAFATGEIEINVTPPDTPTAVIEVENLTGTQLETGKAYVFTAAKSASPAGKIEKYEWEFGDGGKAQTRTATHIYKDAGEYEVTLAITDSAKKKGEASQRYTAAAPDTPPLASIKTTPEAKDGALKGQAPLIVAFDASGSQDPNNNIVEYAWDFNGDNKKDDTNPVSSYTFGTAGTYTVSLTVTDATNLSSKAQITVNVEAAGLKADIKAEPIAGVVPLKVEFDASGSSYPEGTIVAYEWEFGDSSTPRTDTAKVSHQYTAVGTFTAKVTAITSDNKRASSQMPITVRPVPVKACFDPSVEIGPSPLEVQFDPTCSTGTVVQYRWNFANLGQSTDRKPSFKFKDAGEYNISLEVADNQNVVDTFTKTITVTAH